MRASFVKDSTTDEEEFALYLSKSVPQRPVYDTAEAEAVPFVRIPFLSKDPSYRITVTLLLLKLAT
jgi:hypothetical protein